MSVMPQQPGYAPAVNAPVMAQQPGYPPTPDMTQQQPGYSAMPPSVTQQSVPATPAAVAQVVPETSLYVVYFLLCVLLPFCKVLFFITYNRYMDT